MENCLVTKLKSVVNNDNLDKIGVFKLWFKHPTTTTGFSGVYMPGIEKAVIVEGESNFCDANGNSLGNTVTRGNGIDSQYMFFRVSNAANCTIECYSRYNITGRVDQTATNTNWKFLADYDYMNYLNESSNQETTRIPLIQDSYSKLDSVLDTITKSVYLYYDSARIYDTNLNFRLNIANNLKNTNIAKIRTIDIKNTSILGQISILADFTELRSILLNSAQFNIDAELKSISNLIYLTNLQLGSQSQVNGSLEEFVQGQRTNRIAATGETTGEIALPYIQLTKVTWKGSQITGNTNKAKVSWTADSITYYADGTTPDTVNL